MATLLTAEALRHAVANDLFPGDTYKICWMPDDREAINPSRKVFVWDVLENGTVELSAMYDNEGQPPRWVKAIDAFLQDAELIEKNPAARPGVAA